MADLERFKLSNFTYESDKFGYKELFTHLDNFGSMVRSCASGFYLEGMIDSKLHCYPWTGFYPNSDALFMISLFKCSSFVLVTVALSDRSNFEHT